MQTAKKPIKILLVITKSNWGGAQKYVHTLATSAQKHGEFDVAVVSGNDGELLLRLEKEHVPTHIVPLQNSLRILPFFNEVARAMAFLREHKPDVIHINSNKAGVVYGIATTLHKLTNSTPSRSLFTVHGHAFNESRNIFAKTYITLAEMVTFLLVDSIVCVSQKVYDDIPCGFLFKRKATVIYNGIPKYTYLSKAEAQQALGIQDTTVPHFVTIAELNDNKNHLYLLEQLHTHTKPFMYHIIGTGIHENLIKKYLKTTDLHKRVVLHGHVADAHTYLRAFDLFILPSKTEALAYVIQEAAQAGIPTIASRVGGLPEMLPETHMFNLDNPSELRALLNTFETLPANARHFKEEDMLEQTFALYKNI